jgi:hypothetical protein
MKLGVVDAPSENGPEVDITIDRSSRERPLVRPSKSDSCRRRRESADAEV